MPTAHDADIYEEMPSRPRKKARGKPRWVGIGCSVGIRREGDAIVGAKWNRKVDSKESAVGLIHEYAEEHALTILVDLPQVLPLSPNPPPPRTARELFARHNIEATAEDIESFQQSMNTNHNKGTQP